jgi:hypothetical protein
MMVQPLNTLVAHNFPAGQILLTLHSLLMASGVGKSRPQWEDQTQWEDPTARLALCGRPDLNCAVWGG